jgi:ferredoxin-thioredoxin reductase catalytic chain
MKEIGKKEVNEAYEELRKQIEEKGYKLNPDAEFAKSLVQGMLVNQERYGYWACPCRLATGDKKKDLDIICPCDYRDTDLNDYGACYCALYVSEKFKEREQIPERRKIKGEQMKNKLPVWRCKVCGYLCAREHPPEKCPICGVDQDRFEIFE